jgi:predicted ATPase
MRYVCRQDELKIKQIKIREFKNLRAFEASFDPKSLATVLLGQNGTGKSNLLEALVVIFRDLDLGEPASFEYQISYECRGKEIKVTAGDRGIEVEVDGQPVTYSSFWKDPSRQFLPSHVFGYYSGPSSRFESHFAKHQERFYRQLLENTSAQTFRPLFLARLIHSQFVLLAFFYEEHQHTATFLKDYLDIEDLESVLFVLKEPPWSSKQGDRRFWNAKGAVQGFLDKLFRHALAPMRLKQRVGLDLGKARTEERLYLFLKDRKALESLRIDYKTPAEFFKALESTYLSQLLAEARIRVRVRDCGGALTFKELSEGEQQLLTVLGLLRFTREDEALFLLDEPDTHLNPVWSLHYLDLLKGVVGEQKTSQIIMATHDPLTIAGLTREEVRVMFKDETTHQISARVPDQDPKGMGVSGILTSDLFGLRSDLDLETLHLLDEKRDLAVKENLSEAEKGRLRELRKALEKVDLSGRVRDPLYREFVKALWTKGEFKETRDIVLTPKQMQTRSRLALQAIDELEKKGIKKD